MVCIHKTFTNIFCTYIYICCSNRYLRDSGVVAPASKTPKTEAAARAFPYQLFGNAPVLAVCYAHVIFNFARYIVYLLRIIYMYIICIDISYKCSYRYECCICMTRSRYGWIPTYYMEVLGVSCEFAVMSSLALCCSRSSEHRARRAVCVACCVQLQRLEHA